MSDWNAPIIEEFRANEGRVGGAFEGAPMVLLHTRGRKSGREYVNPLTYLPNETDSDVIYVFATKSGAPTNPEWYANLTSAGEASVERGTDRYPVVGPGAHRGRAGPGVRRAGSALPRLRRLRDEHGGRAGHPGRCAHPDLSGRPAQS